MTVELQSQILEPRKWQIGTISSANEKISTGYCLKSDLTTAERVYIFEHFTDAAVISIASAGLHGGRHYSIHDLLGHSVSSMVYVVTNITKFNEFISRELERDFLTRNPEADSRIRSSFTSFMHENKLHWSMCCRKIKSRGGNDLHTLKSSTREGSTSFNSSSKTKSTSTRTKLRRGFLSEQQFHIFDLRSRGYTPREIGIVLQMSKAKVSEYEKNAKSKVERARETLQVYEFAQMRRYKVRIELGTRLQKIPMVVVQRADKFHVHLQPNMVEILKMVNENRQDCLTDGRTTKEIMFCFDKNGELSIL